MLIHDFIYGVRHSSSWGSHLLKAFNRSGYNIRQIGDPILRKQAKPVEMAFMMTPEFKQLVKDLVTSMRESNAAGIAAPQIGHSLQVMALEVTGKDLNLAVKKYGSRGITKMQMSIFPLKVLVNPKMRIVDPTNVTFREGCLSMKYYSAMVPRAKCVEINALNEHGEKVQFQAHGWTARILQHEMDHLNGNIFIDSMMYKTLNNDKWASFKD